MTSAIIKTIGLFCLSFYLVAHNVFSLSPATAEQPHKAAIELTNRGNVNDWRMELELTCETTNSKIQVLATFKLGGHQLKVELSF